MKTATSLNFDERKSAIDMLVIHYTGRPTLGESLTWLTDPGKKVSAHYLVGEEGEVYRLVDEQQRAWHAGVSYWQGETDINSCAIGIELQNPGLEFGYKVFPDEQIGALIPLAKDIVKRNAIPANRILGHSDVAPGRKQDPGEKFPWRRLAEEGIGRWPGKTETQKDFSEAGLRKALSQFGYNPEAPLGDVILAFQQHWRPENATGKADRETVRRLLSLL